MSRLLNNLLLFGRLLRAARFDVPVGAMLDVIHALTYVDVASRDDVFHTCRTLLVRRQEELALFAIVFDAFWRDHSNPLAARRAEPDAVDTGRHSALAVGAAFASRDSNSDPDDSDPPVVPAFRTWSDVSTIARKDFAEFSEDEIARAHEALDSLTWIPGQRRTRRWVRGRGSRTDLRGALARSVPTDGDLLVLPTKRRRLRPRRLVLLCDVSGSMERYSRLLLHFAHGLGQRHHHLEVFLFSTSLTRITRQLRSRHIDHAVAAVSGSVHDWSGGTRIGAALGEFHRRWARRVLTASPVVLLISDGWDRGEPEELRDQVARLQRRCHRLIWLNPLIGSTGYEPLTRGLQAALPFVDDFLPARTLTDLSDLALHLERVATGARPHQAAQRR
jgi:uncharacterized protein